MLLSELSSRNVDTELPESKQVTVVCNILADR